MRYKIHARVWLYPSEMASWHFITLPLPEAHKIKQRHTSQRRGWGSIPVRVTIGKTSWKTSLFPDKKSDSFLLPLKADMRKKEGIQQGDTISVTLEVDV